MLHYQSPFQLLIAVILSAQTTDEQVNAVTPTLFEAFPTPASLAAADPATVEEIIHSVGFYRVKARNIRRCAAQLVDRHGGGVPSDMDQLTALAGVGRKSAGVILHHVFDQPAIIVDTHFARVTRRLGFAGAKAPEALEKEVAAVLRPALWGRASMYLNYHGRRFCSARAPRCVDCPVRGLCPSAEAAS